MKNALTALLLLAATCAAGFDSEGWLGKRALLDREVERLRAAYTNCTASLQRPAEDLTVPIETYPDGSVKASITASRAQIVLEKGLVWGEGVVVRQFSEGGEVLVRAEAGHCVVDRKTKSGWAEGHAKVVYGGTTVEGDGIYFSFPEEFVKILSNVVISSSDLKLGGLKL